MNYKQATIVWTIGDEGCLPKEKRRKRKWTVEFPHHFKHEACWTDVMLKEWARQQLCIEAYGIGILQIEAESIELE